MMTLEELRQIPDVWVYRCETIGCWDRGLIVRTKSGMKPGPGSISVMKPKCIGCGHERTLIPVRIVPVEQ